MLEPSGLDRGDGKRPDGIAVHHFSRGRCLIWDATCDNTFASSKLIRAALTAGSVAEAAEFGFTDTVLQWFSSYLTDRTHNVSLSNHCSAFTHVHSCVPQGSVHGPILFTMYVKPLSAIIDSHSIIHHSFADDLQLQMSAPTDRISELLHSMQSCISDVKAWATANILKLNDSKTELMLVTSKRSKHLHNLPTSITIGNAQIPFKQSVKNLGFTLDCHLTMNAHVSNIARTCYFELLFVDC